MKKILSLLALVCLSCMGAWAQSVYQKGDVVTQQSDLHEGDLLILGCKSHSNTNEAHLFYCAANTSNYFDRTNYRAHYVNHLTYQENHVWKVVNVGSTDDQATFELQNLANENAKLPTGAGFNNGTEAAKIYLQAYKNSDSDNNRFAIRFKNATDATRDTYHFNSAIGAITNDTDGNGVIGFWDAPTAEVGTGSHASFAFYRASEIESLKSGVYEIKNVSTEGGVGRGYLIDYTSYEAGPSIGACTWTQSNYNTKHPQDRNDGVSTCSVWYVYKDGENGYYMFPLSTLGDKTTPRFLRVGTQSSNKATWSNEKVLLSVVDNTSNAGSYSIKLASSSAVNEYLSMGCGTESTKGAIAVDQMSDGGAQLQFIPYTDELTSEQQTLKEKGIAAIEYVYVCHPLSRVTTLETGKEYMLYNACLNGDEDRTGFVYGSDTRVTHCGSHPNPLTYQATGKAYLWTLEEGTDGGYYIKNVATQKYYNATGNPSATPVNLYIENFATTDITKGGNAKSAWGTKILTDDVKEEDGLFAIGGSASGNNGQNCWNGNPTAFANWSNSHPWAFYEVCEVEATINEDVIAVASDYADYKVSQNAAHTNKYGTYQENTRASVDALTTNSTYAEYEAALNAVSSINVIAPAKGSFLRMQGTSGKYISGTAETKSVSGANRRVTTDNAEDAIFWYGTDGALVGYKSGQGFTATCEVAGVGAEMNTQVFGGDASSVVGTLTIISAGNGANTNSYFYDHTDPYGVVNRNGTTHHANCDWTVTDVDALPVNMVSVAGAYYASLHLPVAVTLPAGVTAYSGEVEGDVLTLTEVVTAGALKAYTPVILYSANAVTEPFAITTDGTGAGNNDLSGTLAAQSASEGSLNYGAYVLNKSGDNVGFYKTTTKINGFKAYLGAGAVSSSSNALSFRFEDVVTAIDAINANNSNAEIFDLQGRRLTKAQKGMNIINGHKVLVR